MEIYKPPASELEPAEEVVPKREKLGKVLSYLSLASLLPIIGIIAAAYQMINRIQDFRSSDGSDPELVASEISQSLVPLVLTMIPSLLSILCIFAVLFATTYRSKRFFRVWVFASIMLILLFPVGTLYGLVLGIALFVKRKEFPKKV